MWRSLAGILGPEYSADDVYVKASRAVFLVGGATKATKMLGNPGSNMPAFEL